MRSSPRKLPQPGAVLAKGLVRVAQVLGLTQTEVADIVGSSPATISRTFAGGRELVPDSAEGRHALLLVRVFRSLDTLVGGDREKARSWLRADNRHLGAAPIRLLSATQGLVHVAEYLDAMRGSL
ncbi:MAG TPA: antitoxin Xre/MbcA/ParS toxin-binding domain-containing protein [Myxococcales bacterium]|jgi:transcriptional regulator with XRE-family HTH domain|nr:antitoxin Xre/MbcA/ParS toxin-binding domain-containing protein [Myxococcales bacterium]